MSKCKHRWNYWGRPIITGTFSEKAQWRECASCGLAQVRIISNDGQSNVAMANESMDVAKEQS